MQPVIVRGTRTAEAGFDRSTGIALKWNLLTVRNPGVGSERGPTPVSVTIFLASINMVEHPSFTLAALLPAGGVLGYLKTRSAPSLISGHTIWGAFSCAELTELLGYLIKENRDYETELALVDSVILLASAIPRIINTQAKSPVPIILGVTGSLATFYYQKKVRMFRFGV
ncbi:uncharacterized protein N7446_005001 [Penicillium canescens]|uniref:Uncharacterized protein n=1 Tax=Penicillium canescens TaxID=5083 RepID=A0AAD6N2V3_PENCN|nr:uncharacterized protein N7446_005001 [Penicillium canescens]KAJ6026397.1 hypothetical protein N7460_011214 [Penicillium canescens]KAJ6039670.1 hypothetical protein N7444_008575 [Penicillium canescens]KAJ6067964.1 hypothetical protein N7446_005001 [Penicillium canescens]